MLSYLVRRLSYAIIMLVLISFVSFVIIQLPPGDYLTHKLADLQVRGDRSALDRIDEYRARYGLDEPFMYQYWNWVSNFVKGDFGKSFKYERPVADLLGERLMMTVVLTIATLAVTWIIAIPIGVYSATHQYSLGDQIFTTISFIGLGTPSFVLALIVLFIAVVILNQDVVGLFSRIPGRRLELGQGGGSTQAPVGAGFHRRLHRHGGLDSHHAGQPAGHPGATLRRGDHARGLKNRTVIWKHAVRIAINPLIVILGSEALPSIIGGNALMAVVLNLPTMGPMWVEALQHQDMYMAGTGIVFFTLFLLIGNLCADLALAWMDPRIRLE